MEDWTSPSAVGTPCSNSHPSTPAERPWQLLVYQKGKSKSSLWLLIGTVALIAVSYAVLMSALTNALLPSPLLSPRIRRFSANIPLHEVKKQMRDVVPDYQVLFQQVKAQRWQIWQKRLMSTYSSTRLVMVHGLESSFYS